MPPQEAIAFAAPRAEEITKVATIGAGAGIAGLAQGVIVKVAPQMGAAAPILTWGALLGAPLAGTFAALFTRGMLGDLGIGIAAGGTGVLAYSLPELIAPALGRKAPGANLTAEQRALLAAGGGYKLLSAGPGGAPARAQAAAMSLAI